MFVCIILVFKVLLFYLKDSDDEEDQSSLPPTPVKDRSRSPEQVKRRSPSPQEFKSEEEKQMEFVRIST